MVTGLEIPIIKTERRPGDPAVLVASPDLAKQNLGWTPEYTDLTEMVESAWNWRKRNLNGYAG